MPHPETGGPLPEERGMEKIDPRTKHGLVLPEKPFEQVILQRPHISGKEGEVHFDYEHPEPGFITRLDQYQREVEMSVIDELKESYHNFPQDMKDGMSNKEYKRRKGAEFVVSEMTDVWLKPELEKIKKGKEIDETSKNRIYKRSRQLISIGSYSPSEQLEERGGLEENEKNILNFYSFLAKDSLGQGWSRSILSSLERIKEPTDEQKREVVAVLNEWLHQRIPKKEFERADWALVNEDDQKEYEQLIAGIKSSKDLEWLNKELT